MFWLSHALYLLYLEWRPVSNRHRPSSTCLFQGLNNLFLGESALAHRRVLRVPVGTLDQTRTAVKCGAQWIKKWGAGPWAQLSVSGKVLERWQSHGSSQFFVDSVSLWLTTYSYSRNRPWISLFLISYSITEVSTILNGAICFLAFNMIAISEASC